MDPRVNGAAHSPARRASLSDPRKLAKHEGLQPRPAYGRASAAARSCDCRRRLRAPGSEDETLGKVTCHRVGFQANSGKSAIAVRTQEVERRPGDVRALKLPVVGGIARNRMRAQQVAETG